MCTLCRQKQKIPSTNNLNLNENVKDREQKIENQTAQFPRETGGTNKFTIKSTSAKVKKKIITDKFSWYGTPIEFKIQFHSLTTVRIIFFLCIIIK